MQGLVLRFGIMQAMITAVGGILAPVMYLMFADKGLQLDQIGILVAVATLSAMCFELPFGVLADNYGRKRVFIVGECLLLVVAAGLWLADSFEMLLVFMALSGMSTALFSGTLDALFVEKFIANQSEGGMTLQQAQASFGIFQVLGIAAGSLLAGLLPGWLRGFTDASASIGFYEINCVLMIPLVLMHMGLTVLLIEESAHAAPQRRETFVATLKPFVATTVSVLRSSRTLQVLLFIDLLGGMAMISLEQLWQPRLAEFVDQRDSTWIFGALFAANYVCMAAGQALSIPLTRLFGQRYDLMLVAAELGLGTMFVVFALQQSLTGFAIAYLGLFLVAGLTLPTFLTLFHMVIPEAHRSTMLSVKSLFTQGGAMGGAILAGFLAKGFGIATAWTVAGAIMVLSASMYLMPAVRRFGREFAVMMRGETAAPTSDGDTATLAPQSGA